MPETIPPSANFGIAANALITPPTAVAMNAGVVNIAAGPVAAPDAVAPAIACEIDCANIIEISFKTVVIKPPIKPSKPSFAKPSDSTNPIDILSKAFATPSPTICETSARSSSATLNPSTLAIASSETGGSTLLISTAPIKP